MADVESIEKVCLKCEQNKPLSEFYWRTRIYAKAGTVSSPMSECKVCRKKYEASRYRHRRPRIPEGMKWCGGCREHKPRIDFSPNAARADGLQSYCRTCQPRAMAQSVKAIRDLYRPGQVAAIPTALRRKASHYVSLAVFFGDLVPKSCEMCGKVQVQAHHADYLRPLAVTWLCRGCHSSMHGHGTGFMTHTFRTPAEAASVT